MTWKFGRQTPDNTLMRFVARRFPKPARFLDIGSGEGANSRELWLRGHAVTTLDSDPEVAALIQKDIRAYDGEQGPFDCVYDINALCHVEDPPLGKIKSWIKPEGYFFSICPHSAAPKRVCDGKAYTRLLTLAQLEEMLRPIFPKMRIYGSSSPDFIGGQLVSWIVEARP